MPTSLPARRRSRPDLFLVVVGALSAACFLIQIADPAPAAVEAAALVTSP